MQRVYSLSHSKQHCFLLLRGAFCILARDLIPSLPRKLVVVNKTHPSELVIPSIAFRRPKGEILPDMLEAGSVRRSETASGKGETGTYRDP